MSNDAPSHGVSLMTEEQDKYFKRLTYVAAKLTRESHTVGSAVNSPQDDSESDTASDSPEKVATDAEDSPLDSPEDDHLEVEDQVVSAESSSASIALMALLSLANLVLRKNKIIAVVSGSSSVTIVSEPSAGRLVFSKNPRRDTDISERTELASVWQGNVGMRSLDITPSDSCPGPISPDREFLDHLSTTLFHLRKSSESQDYYDRLLLFIYFIRTGFPKMMSRAAEHYGNLKIADKETMDGSLPTDGDDVSASNTGDSGKKGKKKAAKAFKASGTSSSSNTLSPNAYDYGLALIPQKDEACKFDFLQSHKTWKAIYDGLVIRFRETAKPFEEKFLIKEIPAGTAFSPHTQSVLKFAAKKFKTTTTPTMYTDLHAIYGSLILGYFSGLKTLSVVYTKDSLKDFWEKFASRETVDLDDEMLSWLQVVALCGSQINKLCRGTGDQTFLQFLEALLPSAEHANGCRAWLQMCTEHFGSFANLQKPEILPRLQKARVTMLEVCFEKGASNYHQMMSLEDFFEALKAKDLTQGDRAALVNDIRKSQGVHKGIDTFSGTMHAETLLVLLVLIYRKGYKAMLPGTLHNLAKSISLRHIGVSKLCCPVCKVVIGIAKGELNMEIQHAGSHGIWSACSLPPWTPEALAAKIIAEVERRVVKKLILPRSRQLRDSLARRRGSSPTKDTRPSVEYNDDYVDSEDDGLDRFRQRVKPGDAK
ncbi:hypothetical protein BJ508DRAFT_363157 [Ascobolus immersus RN42]|uniref:Uncharacterized protein n=1 Tax=Ascobolus immersus RN42 TaxID=1160509 RepID=A0A3N4HZY7_ASCIM|nr:hypothetical protein BJ508DRAFT_363157 [Ascobolus immersus RN42]